MLDDGPPKMSIEDYERILFERNDDDWFVPNEALEIICEREYRAWLKECAEEYERYRDE